tara:strand:+ start:4493 stop:5425 length:933 start_codon:yes stop_codon:yes gene_type:complete
MKKEKILNYLFILFFLFQTSQVFAKISNAVVITVGNLPITYLDIVKEMKLVSIISGNKIDDSNKEQIKNIAAKSLIKRRIKELEINKYEIKVYNKSDLERLIKKTSLNLGTDKNGLKTIMESNNLNFKYLEKKFEIDLKWNTLIFDLYKNKVVLNMNEIKEKITSEIESSDANRTFLLSEIEVNLPEDNLQAVTKKIMDNIKKEGFENSAKKFSISKSAEYGGNIGWISEKNLSRKIYENVKDLETNKISKPIILENTMLIVKKMGEKVFEKNIEVIKNKIIRIEKDKKLKMFSNSHYSNLERTTQINFL